MKLPRIFYRLPLRFDADRMAEEISQFSEEQWRAHPSNYEGNTALILVSSNGGQNDDMECPMQPTEYLKRCPYLQQVLASFNTVIGRSRLMRLAPGATVSPHSDVNYYWRTHTRLHIPIVTDPSVQFTSRDKTVHMAAGEAWTFDNWYTHRVVNPSEITRVHLVADTVGTASLWNMLEKSATRKTPGRLIAYEPDKTPTLTTELYRPDPVLSPGDLDMALLDVAAELRASRYPDRTVIKAYLQIIEDLRHDWRSLWMIEGPQASGWPRYRKLIARAEEQMMKLPADVTVVSNGLNIRGVLGPVLAAAFTVKDGDAARKPRQRAAQQAAPGRRVAPPPELFDRPVFIIAAPRSGSTLLFETLASNRTFYTLGDESHQHFEGIAELHPSRKNFSSNRLIAADATPAVAAALRSAFYADLLDSDGKHYTELPAARRPARVRFLEKTPKNALRIPFLRAVFPDARFIYLYRSARDNISSLLDSWRSGRYVTYRALPDWEGPPWSHLLIPGWESLRGAPLADIVKQQWRSTNQIILDDLEALPDDQWCPVCYEDLLKDPAAVVQRLCEFADVPFGPRMQQLTQQPLKASRYTLTAPDPDKWRRNAAELEGVLSQVSDLDARLRTLAV